MEQIFTVETANRALVHVTPILRDIVEKFSRLQKIQAESGESQEGVRLSQELTHHLEELSAVGAILQDPIRGIIDFPCVRNDEVVMLCWMYGEEHVTYWHGDTETFQKRRPIDEAFFLALKA